MKTLDFYQVACPKCHGQINSIAPLSGQMPCPFCGTVFLVTANVSKKTEVPGQIVHFATSIGDFEQSARKMLFGEDYAPANISEIISFKDIKGIYLPVYLYEGMYECAWSSKIKQDIPVDADADVAKNRKEVYRQQNGVSKGNYSIVCMACKGEETGKELDEYVRTLDYKGDGIKPFLPEDLNEYLFLNHNRDINKTWTQWGKDILDVMVRKNTQMQLQSNDFKCFKYTITSDAFHEGKFIFFPIWMVNYQYDGELHHIFMDGTGRNGVKGTTLVDRVLKAEAEKPFTILKYIAVAAIIIPLLMLLAGWSLPAIITLIATGLVFFGYRFYARWNKGRLIRKTRKKFNV